MPESTAILPSAIGIPERPRAGGGVEQRGQVETVRDRLRVERSQLGQRVRIVGGDALAGGERHPDLLGLAKPIRVGGVAVASRQDDCLAEQSLRERRSDQHVDRHATRGLSDDGDIPRIAAERRDVSLHPFEGRELIHVAVVAKDSAVGILFRELGMGECAEGPNAIVEAEDEEALAGEFAPE